MAKKSAASLEQVVEGFKAHPVVVGIDVHKRSLSVALLRADGKVHTFVCPADPEGLLRQIGRRGIAVSLLVQEAGPTGFGLARAFKGQGIKVIVAVPSRIPRAVAPGAKCDRLDCIKLAQLGLAPMVRHSGAKGRIMPTGQKRLRSLRIEAAWVWKCRDPHAAERDNRMLGRMSIPQEAIGAVARKLAIILWRLCMEQRPYRYGTV